MKRRESVTKWSEWTVRIEQHDVRRYPARVGEMEGRKRERGKCRKGEKS
jgi:hypothetical protein